MCLLALAKLLTISRQSERRAVGERRLTFSLLRKGGQLSGGQSHGFVRTGTYSSSMTVEFVVLFDELSICSPVVACRRAMLWLNATPIRAAEKMAVIFMIAMGEMCKDEMETGSDD